jgi:predicted small lipoprotein YifL
MASVFFLLGCAIKQPLVLPDTDSHHPVNQSSGKDPSKMER